MARTKKVLLMRHAKSSWNNPGLRDFDRPLNERGKSDAPRMGQYLKELQLIPDQIISSPAQRAKSTILKVIDELDIPVNRIVWDENLYFNGSQAYIDAIRNANDSSEIVMTVGHNPMTEDAILALSGNTAKKRIKTATIACFEFEVESWQNIQFGSDSLKWIIWPKDLK